MRFIVVIILLLISTFGFTQTRIDSIFDKLPEGALLVRLKTNENTIKALKGKDDVLMQKVINRRNKENSEIINAFKGFTYCPVYFFYSTDSRKIINGEFENVLFDFNMNYVPDTLSLYENYLIATFDYTRGDTSKYYMNTYLGRGENGLEYWDQYGNGSMSTGIAALILLSPELVPIQRKHDQLIRKQDTVATMDNVGLVLMEGIIGAALYVREYPNYVRTFKGLPFIERSKERTIELLQYKLEKIDEIYLKYNSVNVSMPSK